MKHFNKVFQQKSLKANEVEISDDGKKVIVFRHDFQPKGKSINPVEIKLSRQIACFDLLKIALKDLSRSPPFLGC